MPEVAGPARIPQLEALPGLVHGFGRRAKGAAGEPRERTEARTEAALVSGVQLLLLRQVHGAAVAEAPWDGRPEADAAVATRRGLALGIQTADCLPVLLVDPRRGSVAAAHAGWRGTARGVVVEAVRALVARGSDPRDVLAALGPGIGPCCYEVGEELREAFGAAGEPFFHVGPSGRPHLDVRAANVRQLHEAGVAPEKVFHLDECTRCRAELYHSYRRDGPGAGRMISYVGFCA
jgi:YfiH family protein